MGRQLLLEQRNVVAALKQMREPSLPSICIQKELAQLKLLITMLKQTTQSVHLQDSKTNQLSVNVFCLMSATILTSKYHGMEQELGLHSWLSLSAVMVLRFHSAVATQQIFQFPRETNRYPSNVKLLKHIIVNVFSLV